MEYFPDNLILTNHLFSVISFLIKSKKEMNVGGEDLVFLNIFNVIHWEQGGYAKCLLKSIPKEWEGSNGWCGRFMPQGLGRAIDAFFRSLILKSMPIVLSIVWCQVA